MLDSLPAPFTHRFRVRYAEVDPQSVVFNSRYLEYADLLITEHWRASGVHFAGDNALEFHVVRAEVDFRSPIRVDEWVEGRVWTERTGRTSVTTRIELWCRASSADEDGPFSEHRASVLLVHVNVDLASGDPQPIPEAVKLRLTS